MQIVSSITFRDLSQQYVRSPLRINFQQVMQADSAIVIAVNRDGSVFCK